MIDVIIPAYNAHDTINDTLFSILEQENHENLNVYIINDASNKDYSEIVESYADKLNIYEIKLEVNSGPGVAREEGLKNSNSEYIVFIDADDVFYHNSALQVLYEQIQNSDMVVAAILNENDYEKPVFEFNEGCLHGKMYRRSIIEKNNIHFSNFRTHEDNSFNQLYSICCSNISFFDNTVYKYRHNKNSLTNSSVVDRKESMNNYVNNMVWFCNQLDNKVIYNKRDFARRMTVIIYYCYFNYLLDFDLFDFILKDIGIIKEYYYKYYEYLDYSDRVNIFHNFTYPIIPEITLFQFLDKIN